MNALKLVVTGDGSDSLYNEKFDQHYHSLHGALQESMHVFINAGLKYKQTTHTDISILEIGFGTGLNTLLTLQEAPSSKINYTAIEKFPLSADIIEQLNYASVINNINSKESFRKIHAASWNAVHSINDLFLFKKVELDFENIDFNSEFDIIYYDAFAPNAQPELWTIAIFTKMYNALKSNGILVTYCAKGEVKRNLKAVGFEIEALPGPIGKREMTRAHKK